ncbi:multiple sugar transport system ATP-binding protein [Halohasta litchfieldiae]|jgi:multiple sugar transport system ATP-binding protein|uniref:ABC-type D-xylose/L-arabinose transporter n=1 Tax=Halohasta litchfieldiae TaxID=1073996 RepID=A0A1H6ULT9_9EURY|nr:ABC transporter ATP-binding protein [Halohasta litchfieldiae]ATW89480.1 multiple sugar transport system ATP-binding protein [Halohasta litchfieldiae]SEI93281.1 carbohydrate ABC transporter ATP-binding protein, CUT1 family [Halohasta litchfieldiae]
MAELTLDGVTKVFTEDDGNEIVAVDEVSVDIQDGEFLVLVGPSGCGKSTTLRMVAGLESITSGEIRLAGNRINDKPPAERDIAMVFQSYALYPHMTVAENMSFGLEESTEMADDEISRIVDETTEMMGISDLRERKPADLSGGQQQRVALGRAIVRDPEAFLMDEPLSNLDAKLRATMRTELQRLQEELGVTTIYVTHDQTEAMTMGDRIAILDGGVLQQVGTPLECYHTPNNEFVAGFIGDPSMNFFEMDVDRNQLLGDLFEYPLTPAQQESVDEAREVTFGIRPEDIDIEVDGTVDSEFEFEVTVDVVEPRGDENTIHLTFDRDVDDPETFTATVSGLRQLQAGDAVVATFPPEAIHLFDVDSGAALHNRSLDVPEATEQLV